jgi:hypothetical protein
MLNIIMLEGPIHIYGVKHTESFQLEVTTRHGAQYSLKPKRNYLYFKLKNPQSIKLHRNNHRDHHR